MTQPDPSHVPLTAETSATVEPAPPNAPPTASVVVASGGAGGWRTASRHLARTRHRLARLPRRLGTFAREHKEIAAAVVGGLLAILGTIVTNGLPGGADAPSDADRTVGAAPPAGPEVVVTGNASPAHAAVVTATVVNTGGDGVYTYAGPNTRSRYRDGYLDNDLVRVVCQERNGQLVADVDPAPGQPARWPVWNRLEDGRWIPDLWTNLPKEPGPDPPHGLPTCPATPPDTTGASGDPGG
ncbi:hypothetical protein [Plantactinospora sp. B5E13]|uniref:hypothetical protein n=1 Tax=unclassified Plantactinospora TaxID=2631981 RepID=UPI00325CF956